MENLLLKYNCSSPMELYRKVVNMEVSVEDANRLCASTGGQSEILGAYLLILDELREFVRTVKKL